jgi:hypothetical protein
VTVNINTRLVCQHNTSCQSARDKMTPSYCVRIQGPVSALALSTVVVLYILIKTRDRTPRMGEQITERPLQPVQQHALGTIILFEPWPPLLVRFFISLLRQEIGLLKWGIRPSQESFSWCCNPIRTTTFSVVSYILIKTSDRHPWMGDRIIERSSQLV